VSLRGLNARVRRRRSVDGFVSLLFARVDTDRLGGLHARLCRTFLVSVSQQTIAMFSSLLHCENIRKSTDILRRFFHILTYTSASVNRRNNEATLNYIADVDTDVKIWKTCRKTSVDIRIFFTVYSIRGGSSTCNLAGTVGGQGISEVGGRSLEQFGRSYVQICSF